MDKPKNDLMGMGNGVDAPNLSFSESALHPLYRSTAVLSADATGTLYRAEHALDGYEVAIKTLSSEVMPDRSRVTEVAHTNIIKVRELLSDRNGSTLVLLDPPSGSSLGAVLAKQKKIKRQAALTIILRLLAILKTLHQKKIVHKNVNPNTVFLTRTTRGHLDVVLMFLGLNGPGSSLNDPAYLSPEQTTEAEITDPRTDIWAVGVLLYELLFQKQPFEGNSKEEVIGRILLEEFYLPDDFVIDYLPLADVLTCALRKSPGDRFANAGAMIDALLPIRNKVNRDVKPSRLPGYQTLETAIKPLIGNVGPAPVVEDLQEAVTHIVNGPTGGEETDELDAKTIALRDPIQIPEGMDAHEAPTVNALPDACLAAMASEGEMPTVSGLRRGSGLSPSQKTMDVRITSDLSGEKGSHRAVWVAVAAVVLLAGLGAFLWWSNDETVETEQSVAGITVGSRVADEPVDCARASGSSSGKGLRGAKAGALDANDCPSPQEARIPRRAKKRKARAKPPAEKKPPMITVELEGLWPNTRVMVDEKRVTHPIRLRRSNEPVRIAVYAKKQVLFKKTIVPNRNYIISFKSKKFNRAKQPVRQNKKTPSRRKADPDLASNPFGATAGD